jgi:hypothetical protein
MRRKGRPSPVLKDDRRRHQKAHVHETVIFTPPGGGHLPEQLGKRRRARLQRLIGPGFEDGSAEGVGIDLVHARLLAL